MRGPQVRSFAASWIPWRRRARLLYNLLSESLFSLSLLETLRPKKLYSQATCSRAQDFLSWGSIGFGPFYCLRKFRIYPAHSLAPEVKPAVIR
jgi:hypothetical protein